MPNDSIEALAATLSRTERMTVKAELKRAQEVLQPGESPQLIAVGAHEGSGNSLIILTDRRLITLNETGSFNKTLGIHDVALERITTVASQSGRMGSLTVETLGSRMHIHRMLPGERAGQIADRLRSAIDQPTSTSTDKAENGPAVRLASAKAMLDSGAISQDEFDAIRQRILTEI